jgi:hypothetical protein
MKEERKGTRSQPVTTIAARPASLYSGETAACSTEKEARELLPIAAVNTNNNINYTTLLFVYCTIPNHI